MSKLVAILSGGDWYDASVDHVVIPDDMDLDAQKAARAKWYKEIYCLSPKINKRVKYLTFPEWLIKNGAREATEDDVIEYSDD